MKIRRRKNLKSKILHSKEFLREFEKFLHKLLLESHKRGNVGINQIPTYLSHLELAAHVVLMSSVRNSESFSHLMSGQ